MIESRRKALSNLFIIMVVMLMVLPFITSFQDVLTRLLMKFKLYSIFQDFIVPYELKVLAEILNLLDVPTRAGRAYVQFMKEGQPVVVYLAWNCVGWQSFVFLIISLGSGMAGKYTKMSKAQAVLIGFLGTYFVNILRLVLVVLMYYLADKKMGLLFHDYFSSFMSIVWLGIFWWIAFTYVLEEKAQVEHAN